MNERQQNLLKIIIDQYINTAQPVGSKLIADQGNFDLSSATIRNEMSELEEQGYIWHPHTSAGRIPTEKGYQYLVDNFIEEVEVSKKQKEFLDKIVKQFNQFEPQLLKDLAKGLAEFSQGAVFVAFSNNDFYYTGISNLFSQPEFAEQKLVHSLSQVIDHLDQVINKIFDQIGQTEVLIGRNNYFAKDCSSIISKYKIKNQSGLLGILGPIRMDYQNNFSLVNYSRDLLSSL
jgi:heat-inducible transcriptional repressor